MGELGEKLKTGGVFETGTEAGGKISPSFSANLSSQWLAAFYTAAISLGLTFILGRALGPNGFGSYSYILTLGCLFFILQEGGFKTLLFREKILSSEGLRGYKDRLFSWALGHVILVTMAGAFFVLFLPTPYRIGILAACLCFGFQAAVNFISSELRAEGLFPRDAIWQATVRTLSAAGILIALFWVRAEPWTVFSGWAAGLLLSLFLSPKSLARASFGGFGVRDLRRACLGFMAVDAATTVYHRCDIILLESLLGDSAQVGYYAAAYRFLDGILLFASPLSLIWFRKLRLVSEETGPFKSQVLRMSLTMFAAACMIITLGVFFGKEIVLLTFGQGYHDSADLLPWLLAALVFLLPNVVLTQAAIAKNIEHLYALAAGAAALLNIGLNLVLIPRFGGLGAAWATIATEVFLTVGLILGLRWRIRSVGWG
jgi:O-antigen/teichoic acid export membrane protein